MNRMNRRTLALGTILAAFMMAMTSIAPAVAADHPAIKFTRKKWPTTCWLPTGPAQLQVLPGFCAVMPIFREFLIYSLGKYQRFLRRFPKQALLQRCNSFHGTLFRRSNQTISRCEGKGILDAKKGKGFPDIAVNTLVTLRTGAKYTVQFLLRPRRQILQGKADVKVSVPILGFVSLTYQQRGIFQKFLVKKGGDQQAVNQLVETLNR